MKGPFTFSKEERLSGRTHIDELFDQGKSFHIAPFKVLYRITGIPQDHPVRLIIAIPKRKIKRAVDRNRLRRLIREAYRLNKPEFIARIESIRVTLHLAIIYTGDTVDIAYSDVEKKIIQGLDKLIGKLKSRDLNAEEELRK
jgi:ribonuclease P protein component